ncbi:HK97 family phage prohead protease [Desulfoscipio gibsoniae]|uniref:Phage prohead protease, HK97 family n=1 Tax=Desulfoscipio gibsoniae DSM 7213 TaxID=767817 RepID=R4K8Z3_9FIRM|nr:HK97 family phage prohead protease [Desulfoscipio gibsoniae]AGK99652.1 phage prohead protease, HK97 family [Desulfoscipio gibsoniae DSM 7213]
MKLYGFSNELRAAGEENNMLLEGRAIVFDQPTVLYEFDGIEYKEIIASTALDKADMSDVVLRYNHNGEYIVLARTRNKSLTLEKRPDGLYMRATLQSDITSHRDLYNAVKSGLIDKMSFGFAVADDGDSYDSATHTRTIMNIRKLFETSLVDQPAYDQTYVEARSRLEQLADVEEYRKALLIRAKLIRRY